MGSVTNSTLSPDISLLMVNWLCNIPLKRFLTSLKFDLNFEFKGKLRIPSIEVQYCNVVVLCIAKGMCACWLIFYPRDITVTLSGVITAVEAASCHCYREETQNPDLFPPLTLLMWFQLLPDSHLLPIQPLLAAFWRSAWNFILIKISLPSCPVYCSLWTRHSISCVLLMVNKMKRSMFKASWRFGRVTIRTIDSISVAT